MKEIVMKIVELMDIGYSDVAIADMLDIPLEWVQSNIVIDTYKTVFGNNIRIH